MYLKLYGTVTEFETRLGRIHAHNFYYFVSLNCNQESSLEIQG